jgi:predicted nuclease with TOPRIM domain
MQRTGITGLTAEQYKAVIAIVDERVKEIRVTREDFDELKGIVRDLAQAQQELTQAQQRTERSIKELTHAQTRMQKDLRNLARQVGSLSDNLGYGLGDIARVMLPGYLQKHYKIKVGELERRFFEAKGRMVEINLYGEGKKDGKRVIILGESKARIHKREVRRFRKELLLTIPQIKGEVLKVMFAYFIHPEATELAKEEGIILVASYQR